MPCRVFVESVFTNETQMTPNRVKKQNKPDNTEEIMDDNPKKIMQPRVDPLKEDSWSDEDELPLMSVKSNSVENISSDSCHSFQTHSSLETQDSGSSSESSPGPIINEVQEKVQEEVESECETPSTKSIAPIPKKNWAEKFSVCILSDDVITPSCSEDIQGKSIELCNGRRKSVQLSPFQNLTDSEMGETSTDHCDANQPGDLNVLVETLNNDIEMENLSPQSGPSREVENQYDPNSNAVVATKSNELSDFSVLTKSEMGENFTDNSDNNQPSSSHAIVETLNNDLEVENLNFPQNGPSQEAGCQYNPHPNAVGVIKSNNNKLNKAVELSALPVVTDSEMEDSNTDNRDTNQPSDSDVLDETLNNDLEMENLNYPQNGIPQEVELQNVPHPGVVDMRSSNNNYDTNQPNHSYVFDETLNNDLVMENLNFSQNGLSQGLGYQYLPHSHAVMATRSTNDQLSSAEIFQRALQIGFTRKEAWTLAMNPPHTLSVLYRKNPDIKIRLGISYINYPKSLLNEADMFAIQKSIIDIAIEHKVKHFRPFFINAQYKFGWMIITCGNKETANWLRYYLNKIVSPRNIPLVLLEEYNFPTDYILTGSFPHSLDVENDRILKRIDAENMGLEARRWKVVQRDTKESLTLLIFSMDEWAFKSLKSRDFSVRYFFGIVNMK